MFCRLLVLAALVPVCLTASVTSRISGSCSVFDMSSNSVPLYTFSQEIVSNERTGSESFSCLSPLGHADLSGTWHVSDVLTLVPSGGFGMGITGQFAGAVGGTPSNYLVAELKVHAKSSATYVITGGTGSGILRSYSINYYSSFDWAGSMSFSAYLDSPFGSLDAHGPYPSSTELPFVFGQPFSISIVQDLRMSSCIRPFPGTDYVPGLPSLCEYALPDHWAGASQSVHSFVQVLDANGDVVSGAAIHEDVPEPASAAYCAIALILSLGAARLRRPAT